MKKNVCNSIKTRLFSVILLFLFFNNIASSQFVQTDGTKIVDGNGNELFFTGMNLGNWLLWEGYLMMGDFNYRTHTQFFNSLKKAFGDDLSKAMEFEHRWRMNYVTDEAIRELKALGFNSVRVPFNYNLFWDHNSSTVSDRGFQYIDKLINYCKKYGVYILLDMHAAPGYQNPGDHCDNLESNSSQPRTSVHFWEGNNVNIAAQVWRHIADRYKNETTIWGYDLINEPVPQEKDKWRLLESMVTMRNAIREVDNNHIIVAEGAWWGSDMAPLDWTNGQTQAGSKVYSKWDNNLVYQTHHYSDNPNQLNDRKAMCDRLNLPLILGEYGENNNSNIRSITDWCLDNRVGYFPWSFKKMSHDRCLWTIQPNNAYNQLKNAINSNSVGPLSLYNDMLSFCDNNIKNENKSLTWHQGFYEAVKNPNPDNTTTPEDNNGNNNNNDLCNDFSFNINEIIEAEDYCNMSGVETENCSEGGLNVGWIDTDDWMAYSVMIPTNGEYIIEYRVASESGSSGFRLETYGGGWEYGSADIPNTGGWQNWTTISHKVYFEAGIQQIEIMARGGSWNINWLRVKPVSNIIHIEAENYFNAEGIETEECSEGGENVGWIDANDWMAYNIDIPYSGSYKIEYRVASPSSNGRIKLEVYGGGKEYGQINVPNTGGWQNWTTISHVVNLDAGNHDLAVVAAQGGWNINWIKISKILKSTYIIEKSNNIDIYYDSTTKVLKLDENNNQITAIYNINGNKILESRNNQIDINHLSKGVYIINIKGEKINKVEKIIVK